MPGAPYPPMHAPYPMPYPPRKSGMPAWVIVLICAAVGLPILGVLALAAIPLFLSNSSEARRAEAEMMLGGLTGQARVAYAKSGMAPLSLTAPIDAGGCEVSPFELQGTYYIVDDAIGTPRHSNSAYLTAHGISASDGTCQHDFQWQGGNGKYTWR
ncbi:MAG: hypothetical protein IT463_09035 [Planctomycetes bacterium]|nr:hypothetical protein [Planctomycetota bacterium]